MTEYIILSRADMLTLCADKPVTAYIDKKPYVLCTDEYYEKQTKPQESEGQMMAKLSKEACDDARRAFKALEVIDEVKEELEKQRRWLFKAGYNAYNIDIAFDTIKSLLKKVEVAE